MSKNWPQDIKDMHDQFGVNPVVRTFNKEKLEAFIKFRLDFLQEELNEARSGGNEDLVDAMIDLCVVAIGTLNALDVDPYKAWDRVHACNMIKKVGIKASRPNPLGLPDLIKPEGWVGPNHQDNHGLLTKR
jgi:hypothetical protein